MKRGIFGRPPPPATPVKCFCGCGGIARFGVASGSHYLAGHAPHERAPGSAPTPPPWANKAGAAAPQGDLFGLAKPSARTRRVQ